MHQFRRGYFKVDCILETNFTFAEQSGTDLWDTIEDHKKWLENLKLILDKSINESGQQKVGATTTTTTCV